MLTPSCTKIIFPDNSNLDLSQFNNIFTFNHLLEMPIEFVKIQEMENEKALEFIYSGAAMYAFLSEKLSKNAESIITDVNLNKYFSAVDVDIQKQYQVFILALKHNFENINLYYKYGKALCEAFDKFQVATPRQWREKFWHSRFDAFDSQVGDNFIQFKTEGSAPFELLEKWIKDNNLTCDIANIQDDFEYWSFTSYFGGDKVLHQDTLDTILSKVITMIDGEKPKANRFRQIYRDMTGSAIPKDILKAYMNGEAAPKHC